MYDFLKRVIMAEMAAYDELPAVLRQVFNRFPRNVSVVQTMSLPGVRKAYAAMPLDKFAEALEAHLWAHIESESISPLDSRSSSC